MGYERPLQCLPLSFMFVVVKRETCWSCVPSAFTSPHMREKNEKPEHRGTAALCAATSQPDQAQTLFSGHHHPAHGDGSTHRNAQARRNNGITTQAHERTHHAAHQELRKSHDGGPRA